MQYDGFRLDVDLGEETYSDLSFWEELISERYKPVYETGVLATLFLNGEELGGYVEAADPEKIYIRMFGEQIREDGTVEYPVEKTVHPDAVSWVYDEELMTEIREDEKRFGEEDMFANYSFGGTATDIHSAGLVEEPREEDINEDAYITAKTAVEALQDHVFPLRMHLGHPDVGDVDMTVTYAKDIAVTVRSRTDDVTEQELDFWEDRIIEIRDR